jgi:plastocyanin
MSPRLHIGAAALACGAALAGTMACFSERAATTQTTNVAACTAPGTAAGATIVFIRDFTFQTATVHVKSGSKVVWVNCEPTAIPHTSTSDAAGWDSGTLAKDASYVRTYSANGTFPYHCAIHPSMKATVIVD